jgi:hypothetical protein
MERKQKLFIENQGPLCQMASVFEKEISLIERTDVV